MGRAGELNMRLEYLLLEDGRLKLRGSKGREGEGNRRRGGRPDSPVRADWFDQTRKECGDQAGHATYTVYTDDELHRTDCKIKSLK